MLSGKQSPRDLTASHEHYLRAIFEVRSRLGYARLIDVARELGVAPPTLSVGLKPLEVRGLLAHDEHRFLVLTARGERVAQVVHYRHEASRTFLRDVLGVPPALAEAEACLLEHDLGGITVERMVDLVKLLRQDSALREHFKRSVAEYHRRGQPVQACPGGELTLVGGGR